VCDEQRLTTDILVTRRSLSYPPIPRRCTRVLGSQTGSQRVSLVSRHDHRSLRLPTEPSPEEEARRVEFPCGRIVAAKPPRERHYGDSIRNGVPDEAQRTELIRQFMERTLKAP
jgi:hypothetical protein